MISLFAKYKDRIVQLPVNPEDLTIKGDVNNKTANIVGLGEVNNLGYEKLKSLEIESFFPYAEASYVNTNGSFEKPDFYIKFFDEIKKARKPFRLIITELEINMLVSIESFEHTYQYGTDDVDYVLELKEYKEHNIKILNNDGTTSSLNGGSDRPVERGTVKTYIVLEGDSLWSIAQKLLGSGSYWEKIYTYNNNKNIIGGNPYLLKAGMELSIPS